MLASLLPRTIIPLAFSEARPYFTAGLITPRMRELVRGNKNTRTMDEWAFAFELDKNSHLVPQRPDTRYHPEAHATFLELGYYIKQETGLVKIGLETREAEKRGLDPWQIVLPSRLPTISQ